MEGKLLNVEIPRIYCGCHHARTVFHLFFPSEILKLEREAAKKAYNPKRIEIDEKIAFGLRSAGPPSIYYPAEPPRPLTVPGMYSNNDTYTKM